jgi:[acyl-carrier-protein] S-malonyltransferase
MSRVAVVFPGQGSQRPGMAKDFFDAFAVSRDVFAEASDTLGLDLRAICFEGDERLDLTEFTQPAILVAEMAMLRALQAHFGLSPAAFGGHSLGEYTALCAAGVFPLASAVRVVRERGALMQAAVPAGDGAMIAVIGEGVGERDILADLGEDDVDVANRNSKDQVVLSGGAGPIARASRTLAERGLEVVPLNVSAPFHSRRMRAIEPAFRKVLEEVSPLAARDKAITVTSNLRGGFHRPDDLLEALTKQISGTVDWIANMNALMGAADKIYEVGPHRPLRGFFKSVGRDITPILSVKVAQRELSA